MSNINKSEKKQLFNREEKNIQTLYCNLMHGFEDFDMAMALSPMENGYFQMLYAPGYEMIGVGDVVAQCK